MSQKDLQACREHVQNAQRIIGFTGAGISTESGIKDFRSPEGVWASNRTVTFQEFIRSEEDRIEYWRQKYRLWPEIRDAQPNAGHLFFKTLADRGKLQRVITQNIDGLHQKSGLSADQVIELHGTNLSVTCLSCDAEISMDEACRRIEAGEKAPRCQECEGYLKPATVSFGQALPLDAMKQSQEDCSDCDLMFSVGSSLVVYPAAGFPQIAKDSGSCLVIVNREPTPLDGIADFIFREEIGEILPRLV